MLEKSYGLLFFLKQPRDAKKKERYVYVRITVDGLAKEFSTKEKWQLDRWDQKTGRASGNKEDAKRFNIFLDEIAGKILAAKTELIRDDKQVTAQTLLEIVTGSGEKRKMVLVEFKNHNKKMEELLGKGYAKGTIDRFKTCYDHIAAFIKYKYHEEDLSLSRLDYEFISELWYWFRTETNNKGFEIERSTNGIYWKNVDFVSCKAENGNSSTKLEYNYIDANPLNETNYYRLKQIDFDGNYEYSPVRMLRFGWNVVTLYPNPVTDYVMIINLDAGQNKIMITDATNRTVHSVNLGNTSERLQLNWLEAGVYFISVIDKNGTTTHHRLIKN